MNRLIFYSLVVICCCFNSYTYAFPYLFDLSVGESHNFMAGTTGQQKQYTIELVDVEYIWEPNLWLSEHWQNKSLKEARVTIILSGKKMVVLQRPYQMPVLADGLRIYIENTKAWAQQAEFDAIKDFTKDVRFSVCAANESWGPASMQFPIQHYRLRSAPYNNTWSSLVPYNLLYYHRGEDYGAIPDTLNVLAILNGHVIASPLPAGDGKSNEIIIRHNEDFAYRLSHVNTEHVMQDVQVNSQVETGKILAKTGSTWNGARNQYNDPHLHVNFLFKNQLISPFPFLIEAYFRDYPDDVIALAGGYQYALPGQAVTLDGTRSIARQGKQLAHYTWKLHNGKRIKNKITTVVYEKPGLYTEELIVKTKNGAEDRDFIQVRVYDTNEPKNVAFGWAYHTPVRGIKPGTQILFWNRLVNTTGKVLIDFGDGSKPRPIEKEVTYSYYKPGIYTVSLSGFGPNQEPVLVKLRVVVENK